MSRKHVRIAISVVALVAVMLAVVLAAAACGGTDEAAGSGDGGEKVVVKIGAAGPFTGSLSKIGMDALNAIEMAVADFNESGAMPGVEVVVEVGDDAGDPAKGAAVADKFASDDSIAGVVGPMASTVCQAALPILDRAEVPMVTQSATADDLSASGYTVFHRICPKDSQQAPAIAEFLTAGLDIESVYLIDDKGTYGQGLADQVETALQDAGVGIVQRAQINAQDKDFSALVTKIKAEDPDVVFLSLSAPAQAANIAKQMRNSGMTTQIMGGDGMKDQAEFIDSAEGATEGAYATSLGPMVETVPEAQDFLERYIAKHDETSLFTGQSYEATMVLLEAVKATGVQDGKVDRAALLETLAKTDYEGILGFPIAFTPEGDLSTGGIFIIQVKDGAFVQVPDM